MRRAISSGSSGQSISFTRDSAGRITHITDPSGNVQNYYYDMNGDLTSYTVKPNFRTLGAKHGKQVQAVAKAVAASRKRLRAGWRGRPGVGPA